MVEVVRAAQHPHQLEVGVGRGRRSEWGVRPSLYRRLVGDLEGDWGVPHHPLDLVGVSLVCGRGAEPPCIESREHIRLGRLMVDQAAAGDDGFFGAAADAHGMGLAFGARI